jgi:ribosomal protein L40E
VTSRPGMAIENHSTWRPVEELRCPTCGARQSESTDTCRRCKSDLRLLRSALEAYEEHRGDSLSALVAGRLEAAMQHARRCHELRPGSESHRLLAVCHLLRGDWPEALEHARASS